MRLLSDSDMEMVREELRNLEGLHLGEMWRYAGYQVFEFDLATAEQRREGGGYRISVLCEWCLAGPGLFRLGSWNFGRRGRREDSHAFWFYDRIVDSPLAVQGFEVDALGGIYLDLEGGFSLEVHPERAKRGSDDQWMIMGNDASGDYSLTLENKQLYRIRWDPQGNVID